MVLVGHSFGGYLVGAYTEAHPQHVKQLVFADPWGFPSPPEEQRSLPLKWRVLRGLVGRLFIMPFCGDFIKQIASGCCCYSCCCGRLAVAYDVVLNLACPLAEFAHKWLPLGLV